MQYLRSPELTYFTTENLYSLTTSAPFPVHPAPGNSLITRWLYEFDNSSFHILSVLLCQAHLTWHNVSRFIHFGINAGSLIFIFIYREKIVHEYTAYNKYFYTTLLLPILLSRDIWAVSTPWLLQIQSHSWDCGHIPEKLIAFPLDICQKWL